MFKCQQFNVGELTLHKFHPLDYHQFIERNPDVLQGKPIIKGTRIAVELIVRKLAAGYSMQQLLDAYPHLSLKQICAALEFAADLIANEEVEEIA